MVRPLMIVCLLASVPACADDGPQALVPSKDTAGGVDADADSGEGDVAAPEDGAGEVVPNEDVVTCEPFQPGCIGTGVSAVCNSSGTGWTKETACQPGTFCKASEGKCRPPVCTPYTVECLSDETYRQCAQDGSGWDEDLPCPDEYVCTSTHCVYQKCLADVLLVVDRSGSMVPNWGALRNSIEKLIDGNPNARFGLLGFPVVGTVCDVPNAFDVSLDTDNGIDFVQWFNANPPGGATPLLATMQEVAALAPALFGEDGGTVVVLSDGADTCFPEEPAELLGAEAAKLANDHGIPTYVIGYNYEGDPTQLNAIAANGGTPYANHIPVGSEGELDNAFEGIVKDFKLCF